MVPSPMAQMQQMVQEMNELARDPAQVLQVPQEVGPKSGQVGGSLVVADFVETTAAMGHSLHLPTPVCGAAGTLEATPDAIQSLSRILHQVCAADATRRSRACMLECVPVTWSVLRVKKADWQDFGVGEAGFQNLLLTEAQPKCALATDEFAELRAQMGFL